MRLRIEGNCINGAKAEHSLPKPRSRLPSVYPLTLTSESLVRAFSPGLIQGDWDIMIRAKASGQL